MLNKELLEMLSDKIKYKKENIGDDLYRLYIAEDALDFLEQALAELKAIKEAKPSEAMECLESLRKSANTFCQHMPEQCELNKKYADTIKQALLKAQEQKKENAEYKEVLRIIFEKNVDILDVKIYENYKHYCRAMETSILRKDWWLTEEEFDLLKRYLNGK